MEHIDCFAYISVDDTCVTLRCVDNDVNYLATTSQVRPVIISARSLFYVDDERQLWMNIEPAKLIAQCQEIPILAMNEGDNHSYDNNEYQTLFILYANGTVEYYHIQRHALIEVRTLEIGKGAASPPVTALFSYSTDDVYAASPRETMICCQTSPDTIHMIMIMSKDHEYDAASPIEFEMTTKTLTFPFPVKYVQIQNYGHLDSIVVVDNQGQLWMGGVLADWCDKFVSLNETRDQLTKYSICDIPADVTITGLINGHIIGSHPMFFLLSNGDVMVVARIGRYHMQWITQLLHFENPIVAVVGLYNQVITCDNKGEIRFTAINETEENRAIITGEQPLCCQMPNTSCRRRFAKTKSSSRVVYQD